MNAHKPLLALVLIGMLSVGAITPVAAHETQNVDGYDITFGGADEPLITGERMWLELEVVDTETGEPIENEAENLIVSVQATGSDKTPLDVTEKHGEPGVYQAPVIFTESGDYMIHLEGSIEGTEVHTHFEKEVHDHTALEYPSDGSQTADDSDESQTDETRTDESGFGSVGVVMVGIGAVAAIGAFLLRRQR
ncbi:FixH family protein [Natronorubrum aibiense]|uniref:YtkA-like domain-containing protein n=1 Tax=Natronorubrum aibiense TaxID=348826 RepID=A0A5P9P9E8_9EURY|nr:FixH family protein [Natronorubrum aibiense]QFU84722.1 hypothetical protein GCU68_19580 [Natronorubrum aibiense]